MKNLLILMAAASICIQADAARKPKFDYSLVFVPEEGGVKFEKITEDADCVADYDGILVTKASGIFGSRKTNVLDWWVIPQIALSPDGKKIGYINEKNKTTNIMIKSSSKGGASERRRFFLEF